MPTPAQSSPSPVLVSLMAWLVPGGGYFLIGQRARALIVGITIIILFLSGIVVGGIRVMDPPGWGQYGYMAQLVVRTDQHHEEIITRLDPTDADQLQEIRDDNPQGYIGSALVGQFMSELGEKPWLVGQILCGPVTLATAAISVHEARPRNGASGIEGIPASHSRSWEIGTLYTAVAGMLNLLVIIDSTYRAGISKLR
jgi:hypothetical protein